jgi:hypothetical protein
MFGPFPHPLKESPAVLDRLGGVVYNLHVLITRCRPQVRLDIAANHRIQTVPVIRYFGRAFGVLVAIDDWY